MSLTSFHNFISKTINSFNNIIIAITNLILLLLLINVKLFVVPVNSIIHINESKFFNIRNMALVLIKIISEEFLLLLIQIKIILLIIFIFQYGNNIF